MEGKKRLSIESKATFSLPEGATILKKDVDMTVEEIENGYIIIKRFEIKYQIAGGDTDWQYFTKKWFTKDNPVEIDESVAEDIDLADKF